ncbi:MAG: site-specific DNA-methyltransferase [Betaproteobacteria bacterium]|nr:site-specific DNA-methyltransferase [Betaproteobacteria bacterium]
MKRPIESYEHKDKRRVNNPPVGLVTPDTDPDAGAKKAYAYDPHLDPQLQWAGKTEHTSFEVPTVSLHVHERIDPRTIIEAVRKHNGQGQPQRVPLFEMEREEPLRQAIDFYKHAHGWSNRLVAGDSLLVMNSLLQKEGMAGKVQMVYIDPPYGITYGSNFQPFVNKRDGKDDDLTAEPEQIRAFRDTWELGIHSYLTYLRDRLLLARDLLTESGSVFVQIGDENVHRASTLMDEILRSGNRVATISFATTSGSSTSYLPQVANYLLWYAKDKNKLKYRQLYEKLSRAEIIDYFSSYAMVEMPDGSCRKPTKEERFSPDTYLPEGARIYRRTGLDSQGVSTTGRSESYNWNGRVFRCSADRQWSISKEAMDYLSKISRLDASGEQNSLRWKKYEHEVPGRRINNVWPDQMYPPDKKYVVETSHKTVQRCLLMTTDPGDLVFDPTCGSGTTAYVAEQWGRRWITCDTSRVALTLAKQRLMTAVFDYYDLAYQQEGVGSGFKYKSVPYVSPKVLAKEEVSSPIYLYDQPFLDKKRIRVSGPFTVEAVPAPAVRSVEELLEVAPQPADASVARSGETLRQGEWRDELLRSGIRGKAGQHIRFARLEPLPGCRWLHADGESRPNNESADRIRERGPAYSDQRIVVSFGPEHAPLEQRQVAQAIEETQTLVPKPKLIVFATFQFDPEAARDIDETNWPGVTLLKVQMNADLLTDDLKKKRATNESFWLIGQPDVRVERIAKGEGKGKVRVSVHGFDYYNTRTGGIESGGEDKIAVWLLDTDYDGRSLYPRQVFFPMADEKEGWARLAKNLKAEIDEDLIEAYRGTASLPFEAGGHNRIAVKIVDDRGIESLKVMELA